MSDSLRPGLDRETAMTEIDQAYERMRAGDARAFEAWLRRVELPLRASLRSFARAVDVEAVLQEGLLRMWKLAQTLELEGPNASLRYALRVVHNLALMEARALKRLTPFDLEVLENLPEMQVDPDPTTDPGLRRLIRTCIELLPPRPRQALLLRLQDAGLSPDRDLAEMLTMKVNTFLQNIVRARKLLSQCLAKHGVTVEGTRP